MEEEAEQFNLRALTWRRRTPTATAEKTMSAAGVKMVVGADTDSNLRLADGSSSGGGAGAVVGVS